MNNNYYGDGTNERRIDKRSLEAIWELLSELNIKVDLHLKEEASLRPQLLELADILQKSKGIILFFKFLLYIGAPLGALFYWIKDHVKL